MCSASTVCCHDFGVTVGPRSVFVMYTTPQVCGRADTVRFCRYFLASVKDVSMYLSLFPLLLLIRNNYQFILFHFKIVIC